ncbi:cytochrome P450 [Dermatobacter hominis]|uniref:cytochrome P450 n=1 Tax=Dermatobacter hominis TaxID=2884263 RepID=UPI001D12E8EE|nr:cytochrome P450 [Dermatobacter hominis]UDY35424.1 cytochrome P450 [Dermatobacter hominis]
MDATPSAAELDGGAVDLCDLSLFEQGFPHAVFARLRAERPVWCHPPSPHVPGDDGFWVLSRYADVVAAASDGATFSSRTGPGRDGGGTLIEDLPEGYTGVLLNMTDDPHHQRFRSLLTPALSPRAVRALADDLRDRSRAIVRSAVDRGEVDLLVDVAAELPLQAAASLLGVPQEDRRLLIEWADATLDHDDRDLGGTSDRAAAAAGAMFEYGSALIERRRADPGSDLLSLAVHGEVDDADAPGGRRPLRDDEVQLLFSLLVAAGTETTRNTIAVGVAELADRPDDWEALREDRSLVPAAVEEMLRHASSTPYNRRTATRDVRVGDQLIRAGDRVTLWWSSANRDEAEFAEPDRFDVRRTPNRHVAFGHGSHFCLGARLARLEIASIVEALLDASAPPERAGPTEWTRSNKHTGVRHLPVRLRPLGAPVAP